MSSEKVFTGIENEYAFFMRHSTEAEEILNRLNSDPFKTVIKNAGSILDFGGGAGEFTESLLNATGSNPDSMTLLEPTESYRTAWVDRFKKIKTTRLQALADARGLNTKFDLVLSNHVLYYVSNLNVAIRTISNAMNPNGSAILTLAQSENALIQMWDLGFDTGCGIPTPYHSAAMLESALTLQGTDFSKVLVSSEISFPDEEHNRDLLLKFLFKDHLKEMNDSGTEALHRFLNDHVRGGQVVLPLVDYIYGLGGLK